MEPRISLITLGVSDLARSTRFYSALGFPPSRHSVEGAVSFFELSGTWLGLFGKADLAKDAGLPLPRAPRPPAADPHARFIGPAVSLSHNLPSPEAVDRAFQEVERAGARIVKRPAKTDWGGYSGYFEDPDGHLWEFAHNPFFWPGPPPLSSTGRKEKARPPPKKRA